MNMRVPPPPPETHQEYHIVKSTSPTTLMSEINNMLIRGWELYGVLVPHSNKLHQALVRTVSSK